MESFGDLLDSLRFRSQVTAVIELREPWGITFPEIAGSVKFHHITSGKALIALPHHQPFSLRPGDVALIVNCEHTISSDEKVSCPDIEVLVNSGAMVRVDGPKYCFGGEGEFTSLITGRFIFEYFDTHPFFNLIPKLILIRAEDRQEEDGIDKILSLLVSEATAKHPGGKAALNRLSDLFFFAAMRNWATLSPLGSCWSALKKDPQIAAAVDIIHCEPSTISSVEQLARRVALSRSAFSERFGQAMGDSPANYLTSWRMHLASVALRERGETISAAASLAGYESEPAFAKAFKRHFRISPGAFRGNGTK